MSKILLSVILSYCPGWQEYKGQAVTTDCQEWFVNCVIKSDSYTEKDIKRCEDKFKSGGYSGQYRKEVNSRNGSK